MASTGCWLLDARVMSVYPDPHAGAGVVCLYPGPCTTLDLSEDRLARQAGAVRAGSHPPGGLGRDDHFVAAGEVLDGPAKDLLAVAKGIAVRGVEKVDAGFQCLPDERATLVLAQAPCVVALIATPITHTAKADARDVEACAADWCIACLSSRLLTSIWPPIAEPSD